MEAGNARHVTRVRKAGERGARVLFLPPFLPLARFPSAGPLKTSRMRPCGVISAGESIFFRYRGLDRLAGNDVAGRTRSHLARVAPPSAFSRALAPSFFLSTYLRPSSPVKTSTCTRACTSRNHRAQLRSRFDEFLLQPLSAGGFVGHERSMKTKRGRSGSSRWITETSGLLGRRTYNGYKSNRVGDVRKIRRYRVR